jgi:hypothetical protein
MLDYLTGPIQWAHLPLWALVIVGPAVLFVIRRARYNAWADRRNREHAEMLASIPRDLAKALGKPYNER